MDAAFTLSLGSNTEEGGLTLLHPLAAGVLDGEAPAYGQVDIDDELLEVESEIQVYAVVVRYQENVPTGSSRRSATRSRPSSSRGRRTRRCHSR